MGWDGMGWDGMGCVALDVLGTAPMRLRHASTLLALSVFFSGLGAACNSLFGTPYPVLLDAGADSDSDSEARGEDATSDATEGSKADASDDALAASADSDSEARGGDATSDATEASKADASDDALAVSKDSPSPFDAPSAPVEASTSDAALPCAGTAGDNGTCPVLLLGSPTSYHGLKSLFGLAVAGGALYGADWYEQAAVVYTLSPNVYTPDPQPYFPSLAGEGAAAANVIATDGTRAYFAVYRDDNGWAGGIYSIGLDGDAGENARTPIATTQGVDWLAVDDQFVYWAPLGGSLWRANKDGSNPKEFDVGMSVGFVARGGIFYYFTATPTPTVVAVNPSDWSDAGTYPMQVDGGSPTLDTFDVATASIFWADKVQNKVYRTSLGAGTTTEITPSGFAFQAESIRVLADDHYVYLEGSNYTPASPDAGAPAGATIYRFLPDGGSLQTMGSLSDGITGTTQDSTAIYFATYGNDTPGLPPYSVVGKVAK